MRCVSGFTIVELMIALAIVGILASIAIPAYSGFVAKARLSEALGFSRVAKSGVAEYYAQTGRLPDSNAQAGLGAEIIGSSTVKTMSVESGGVIKIVVEYAPGQTGTLILTPAAN